MQTYRLIREIPKVKHRKKLAQRLNLRHFYVMPNAEKPSAADLKYLPLQIVFEDEWLIAFNKPAGLLVHGNPKGPGEVETEPNLQDLASLGRRRRLTLFHRLDKDTSGVVLMGKRAEIGETMSRVFEEKRIRKAYFAVVNGVWKKEWNRVEGNLARGEKGRMEFVKDGLGQKSLTTFRVLKSAEDRTWIEAMPKTGRTHQIRVHCVSKGCSILGDPIYGIKDALGDQYKGEGIPGLALHAHRVDLAHPVSQKPLRIEAPIPDHWYSSWLVGLQTAPEKK